jgi:excisionase family DNA binding protein
MPKTENVSPRDAAQELGTRLDTIYQLIWSGKLSAFKLDGRWRIPRKAIETRLLAREAHVGASSR